MTEAAQLDCLIKLPAVIDQVGISRSQIYNLISLKRFPAPLDGHKTKFKIGFANKLSKEKRGNPRFFPNMTLLRTITFSLQEIKKWAYRADEHCIYDSRMSAYENGK